MSLLPSSPFLSINSLSFSGTFNVFPVKYSILNSNFFFISTIIMKFAKSMSHMFSVAIYYRTESTRSMCIIPMCMFKIISKNKIFNTIIKFIAVDMVNYFFGFKVSTNILLHHKSMLKNITISFLKRVFSVSNYSIPAISYIPPTLPVRMLFSFSKYFSSLYITLTTILFARGFTLTNNTYIHPLTINGEWGNVK